MNTNVRTVRLSCGCLGIDGGLDGYVHIHKCTNTAEEAARQRTAARKSLERSYERLAHSMLNGNSGFTLLR